MHAERRLSGREVGCRLGTGNQEFFSLGLGLSRAGLPDYEIEGILKEQSRYAHTPKDRGRNIRHIMRGVGRRKTSS